MADRRCNNIYKLKLLSILVCTSQDGSVAFSDDVNCDNFSHGSKILMSIHNWLRVCTCISKKSSNVGFCEHDNIFINSEIQNQSTKIFTRPKEETTK